MIAHNLCQHLAEQYSLATHYTHTNIIHRVPLAVLISRKDPIPFNYLDPIWYPMRRLDGLKFGTHTRKVSSHVVAVASGYCDLFRNFYRLPLLLGIGIVEIYQGPLSIVGFELLLWVLPNELVHCGKDG